MSSKDFKFLNFIKESKFHSSRNLGQNFLVSNFYIDKISKLIKNNNDFIIEIGPGFGSLTANLIKCCKNMLAIEYDKRLFDYLKNNYPGLNLINCDVLKFDFSLEFAKNNNCNTTIISNLPYSTASQIIFIFLEFNNVKDMVLMLQKEMADKIISNKNSNNFSTILNMIFDIHKEFDVPNTVFFPIPKVDSTVLSFKRKKINFNVWKMNDFLKKCFLQKRKTINNNLRKYFPSITVDQVFEKLSYDKNKRASEFTLEDFLTLYKEFYEII